MQYTIEYRKQARKFIMSQPPHQQRRIIEAIRKLPFEGDIKRMSGGESYEYRLRVGDYRIIYEKHDTRLLIIVVHAGNRGNVYK